MAASEYKEVEVLRDPDGVICVITERQNTADRRYHTFAFFKEFPNSDGSPGRSSFLARRHTGAMRRLLGQLEEWMDRAVEQTYASRKEAQ